MPSFSRNRPTRVHDATSSASPSEPTTIPNSLPGHADLDSGKDAGTDPDPRLTFANERTFLAWNRTSLALIAGGLAVSQFLKAGFGGAQLIVGLPLIALGAITGVGSFRLWQRNDRALRLGRELPPSALPRILFYGVATFAVAAAGLAVLHVVSR